MKIFIASLILIIWSCYTSWQVLAQSTPNFTTSELNFIARQDTLYYGYDTDWRPYQFINEKGEHDGIVEEMLQLIQEHSGLILCPYHKLTWQSSLEALNNETIDILPILGLTEQKQQYMSFTSTYLSFPYVIVNAKNGSFIGSLKDLEKLTLALPKGYTITEVLELTHPQLHWIYTTNAEESLMLVLTKQVDATIMALPIASHYLNYKGFNSLQIATDLPEYDMNLRMAVKKGNGILLSILEKSLQSISEGEKQKIINKWVSVNYEHGVNMIYVWRIAGFSSLSVIIILGIILFWNRSMQKEIERRKIIEQQLMQSTIEILAQKNIIETKNKEITESIEYAQHIQHALLTPSHIVKEYLKKSFILYKPKDIIAGDFYWIEHVDDKIFFAAADCTGHGVPGAMVSVLCHNALNRSISEFGLDQPAKILDKTRAFVIEEFANAEEEVKDGMDIALCMLQGNHLAYAGANNPLWIISNGELTEIKADRQPIGLFDHSHPFTEHTFELKKGDTVYIFSDGYRDQFGGPKGKKFKVEPFRKLLLSIQQAPMSKQRMIIDQVFEEWKGNLEQIDDVCVIGVRI
ncbi:MAG: transporter substrate-binding domain-containing protein [Breznakibacter sp.]|nr:transporter substrate-binding domain-containing protein [Breznakibacter sp.]